MILRLKSTGENLYRKRTFCMQIEANCDQMDTGNIVPLKVELRTSFIDGSSAAYGEPIPRKFPGVRERMQPIEVGLKQYGVVSTGAFRRFMRRTIEAV